MRRRTVGRRAGRQNGAQEHGGSNHAQDGRLRLLAAVAILVAVTTSSYWPVMVSLFAEWQTNDDYSVGQLVPLIVTFLIWRERRAIRQCVLVPCWCGGIPLLILGLVARTYGFLSWRLSLTRYALLITIVGTVMMVGGGQVFRRLFWILAFLFLMVPLPACIDTRVSPSLQEGATNGTVFLLEAFGESVTQEGNIIALGDSTRLGVEEACGGLRMLTAFVIVAAFIAYIVKRPRWQKGVLLVSSIPIAVVCNVVRIFVTAMIMLHVSVELGEKFFHDYAGYVMMPVAVSLVFGEIWLMDRIVGLDDRVPAHGRQQAVTPAARSVSPGTS